MRKDSQSAKELDLVPKKINWQESAEGAVQDLSIFL